MYRTAYLTSCLRSHPSTFQLLISLACRIFVISLMSCPRHPMRLRRIFWASKSARCFSRFDPWPWNTKYHPSVKATRIMMVIYSHARNCNSHHDPAGLWILTLNCNVAIREMRLKDSEVKSFVSGYERIDIPTILSHTLEGLFANLRFQSRMMICSHVKSIWQIVV
jgi:hypothetical protein